MTPEDLAAVDDFMTRAREAVIKQGARPMLLVGVGAAETDTGCVVVADQGLHPFNEELKQIGELVFALVKDKRVYDV